MTARQSLISAISDVLADRNYDLFCANWEDSYILESDAIQETIYSFLEKHTDNWRENRFKRELSNYMFSITARQKDLLHSAIIQEMYKKLEKRIISHNKRKALEIMLEEKTWKQGYVFKAMTNFELSGYSNKVEIAFNTSNQEWVVIFHQKRPDQAGYFTETFFGITPQVAMIKAIQKYLEHYKINHD